MVAPRTSTPALTGFRSVPRTGVIYVMTEAAALLRAFRTKRQQMLEGLEELGIRVDLPPQGGFYCWGDLRRLPEGLRTGMELFRRALDEQVIVVPGEFFDIGHGQRRPGRASRFACFARFSFGPSEATVACGLAGLRRVVDAAR